MEKAAKVHQLIESRTALLQAVAGLCGDDFENGFGEDCLSLKARLAHVVAADWETAHLVREMVQGQNKSIAYPFSGFGSTPKRAHSVEQRCRCSANEAISEAVLSLQVLLDELRPLAEEHFFFDLGRDERGLAVSVASLVDGMLRSAQQHCEEIWSWRGQING